MTALVKAESNIVEVVRMLFPHLNQISDVEIKKAVSIAKHLGLDPTKKECHFIPYKGSLQVVVSYTEYIKRAEKSGKLNGWDVVVGKDDIDVFAEVVIYRKDWQFPLKWRVYLSEAKKETQNWKTMSLFMLKKTAISQAFRLAFPEETSLLPLEEAEITSEPAVEEPVIEETTEEVEDEEIRYTITEGQIRRLWAVAYATAKENKLTNDAAERVVRDVLADYGLEHTKDILREDYDEIIEKIKAELIEIAKEGGEE
jgi:hypothetical protein